MRGGVLALNMQRVQWQFGTVLRSPFTTASNDAADMLKVVTSPGERLPCFAPGPAVCLVRLATLLASARAFVRLPVLLLVTDARCGNRGAGCTTVFSDPNLEVDSSFERVQAHFQGPVM